MPNQNSSAPILWPKAVPSQNIGVDPKTMSAPDDIPVLSDDDISIRKWWVGLADEEKVKILSSDDELGGLWDALSPKLVEKMPKDFSAIDRANVKNFGGTPDVVQEQLHNQYPQYNFMHLGKDARAVAQSSTFNPDDEATYEHKDDGSFSGDVYSLDPNTGVLSSPKEMAMDAADAAWDIGSGTAEALAALAAGVPAGAMALSAGPQAAWAAAQTAGALAAGTTASALELMRQRFGKATGVHGDINEADALSRGVTSALSTLALGTGASGKLGKKYAKYLRPNDTKRLLSAQKGVFGKVADAGIEAVGALAGHHPRLLKVAMDNVDYFKKIEKGGPDMMTNIGKAAQKEIQFPLAIMQSTAANGLKVATEIAENVDISSSRRAFEDLYRSLATSSGIPEIKKQQKQVLDIINEYFTQSVTKVDGRTARNLKDTLSEIADFQKNSVDSLSKLSGMDKKITATARAASDRLGKAIDASIDPEHFHKLTGGTYKGFNDMYSRWSEYNTILKVFGDSPEKAFQALNTLTTPSKLQMRQTLSKVAPELLEEADKLQAFKVYGKKLSQDSATDVAVRTSYPVGARILGGAVGGGVLAGLHDTVSGGDDRGGNIMGSIIAGGIAGKMASPSGLRTMINARNLAGQSMAIPGQASTKAIWEILRTEDLRKQRRQSVDE